MRRLLFYIPLLAFAHAVPQARAAEEVTRRWNDSLKALGSMSGPERDYYDKVFSYAMESLEAGGKYAWKSTSASGEITGGESFTSVSKSHCRSFSETYTIGELQGSAEGYGCRRVDNSNPPGWCRLREGNMMTCALNAPNDPVDAFFRESGETLNEQTGVVNGIRQMLPF